MLSVEHKEGGETMITKKVKIIITVGSLATMIVVSPLAAFAQTVTTSPVPSGKAANQAARLANLHTLADNAINARLTSLNDVATRINGLVKLSSDQKTQFSGEITTDINGLTSLKTKVDADTDLATLRTDYRSIFTTYRIYAEFLPWVHLLVASDTMDVTADKLSDLATKLQSRIQAAGNPSNMTTLLSDMQAKIADARTQYSNVQSQITSLTPQSYDNDPSGTTATIKNARSEIQTGASDLRAAFADAKQIIQLLKTSTTPVPTQ
jgi:hypothetical protein